MPIVPTPRIRAVAFDDPSLTAWSGLVLVDALATRLELDSTIEARLGVGSGPTAHLPAKLRSLVLAMAAGGDHIEHVDWLRSRANQHLVGSTAAGTTVGHALRGLTPKQASALDVVLGDLINHAWARGLGPRPGAEIIIDVDSTILPVFGHQKEGAEYGYTGKLGYHPQLATRAGTNEVLAVRFRSGNHYSGADAAGFFDHTVARVRQAGGTGPVLVRADTAFSSFEVFRRARAGGYDVSVGAARHSTIVEEIARIDETAWINIPDYSTTEGHTGQVTARPWRYIERIKHANRPSRTSGRKLGRAPSAGPPFEAVTLFVRRVRNADDEPWQHFSFITTQDVDRDNPAAVLEHDARHRDHAIVELSIRDLKAGGWAHVPSGSMVANTAWALLGAVAHNLLVWLDRLACKRPGPMPLARSVQRWIVCVPGRVVRSGRQLRLRLPDTWPARLEWCWAATELDVLVS